MQALVIVTFGRAWPRLPLPGVIVWACVIQVTGGPVMTEVKPVTRWNSTDLSGLRTFLDGPLACVAAVLVYNGMASVKLDDSLFAIPLGKLLE